MGSRVNSGGGRSGFGGGIQGSAGGRGRERMKDMTSEYAGVDESVALERRDSACEMK